MERIEQSCLHGQKSILDVHFTATIHGSYIGNIDAIDIVYSSRSRLSLALCPSPPPWHVNQPTCRYLAVSSVYLRQANCISVVLEMQDDMLGV